MDLSKLTVEEVRRLIDCNEASAEEICKVHLDEISRRDPELHAYLEVCPNRALAKAAQIDRLKRDGGTLPPLAGVPMAIKDNIMIEGLGCTCGSKILENFLALYNATVIERLEAAGAVFLGKTNQDEFAMGSSTENSAFFPVRNPHALDRVPGGSSGGSAAAVASQMAVTSLGSDTGGSIRQPASLCGVVGLKPTYSRVSRYGLVAYGSSLDQIGPLARTVKDVAAVLGVIAGGDPHDSTCSTLRVPNYLEGIETPVKGLRIGMPKQYFGGGIDPQVREKVNSGLALLESLGCSLVEVDLPHTDYAIACYYILATAEASSNLARYDGVRYGLRVPGVDSLSTMYRKTRDTGFGAEVKRRIILGTFVLSSGYYDAYYLKGQKVRTLIKRDFEKAFETVDFIISPTSPTPAFRLGEKSNDPLAMYLSDIFTITANLVGIPGISLPCGKTTEGLPVGLQILGRPFDEQCILRLSSAFEQAGGFEV
ncbi:MAG TPA: Asp-tRNA(Asn)/Glu-tRNA(Gln) amidotransferase subunit GatA [Terriglobia bacterium]|nr:Asp-tRNA(Asn)/Glu-tRNA(Gln) amidotransferase subunit GatA [Terriglobia bacterium]